ncbi:MAG: hypothetical protein AAF541_15030 [Pseudomonadota bacterium]
MRNGKRGAEHMMEARPNIWPLSVVPFLILGLVACSPPQTPPALSLNDVRLDKAEAFIDAFYSFDAGRLAPLLADAPDSKAGLLYYQGWAEGGNYKIVDRGACVLAEVSLTIVCPITVQDDPVLALQTGFNVTDTFTITFEQEKLVSVETSSNDQPIYYQAREWVLENMPDIMEGPCDGFFDGGATPVECARAMTYGYQQFAQSDAFPVAASPDSSE